MKRKLLSIFFLVALTVLPFSLAADAQEQPYPGKAIQIVVASRAGGGTDLFFRILAEKLKAHMKVPVQVANETGALGITGANNVANAKKDGYTLLGIAVGTLSNYSAAKPDGAIHLLRDFDPLLVNVDYASMVCSVRSDSKFKSLKEIVSYAREKPGELICGTGQRATDIYLEWELFKRAAKVDITSLPFSGSSEVIPQLLGGHIQISMTSDVTARPYVESGKIRGLATDTRSLVLRDLPTFAESGYPDVNLFGSIGLFGPKGLPSAVSKVWGNALELVLKDPEFIASTKKLGFKTNYQLDSKKNETFFKEEIKKYARFTPEELGWK